ncbi:thiosulfate oxidation carrier complex protein SoxZ [Zeimonas arvi]|uniref:Thiosulfate oxidation carrier complex protein SoxZ n=1 Tax=Zeimonas arvi TaxID=2498847 RepID=A0A5C8NRC1_9BURK|nr:thiosulfate oxidation carrier complex protein SoxZ [Zeimonas arvi]ODT35736.1 MAG: thiosulfate oxidation carrier complex protein SoxZ [Lautropia sp. SCN 70-15]TXL63838.1 thiosulfate oxidation carrier complex protein SoxZ [Zeimonas arvi]
MADPMKIRASAKDGVVDVRVLMAHEMETGQRKDASGNVVPAWFISDVTASLNGKEVLKAHWGPAISKNPYLQFKINGGKAGDKVTVSWVDNKGDKRTDETTVS